MVDILPLAPEIEEISTNKFYGTASITTPIISKDLFLYRYLMVQRVPIGYNGYIDEIEVYIMIKWYKKWLYMNINW